MAAVNMLRAGLALFFAGVAVGVVLWELVLTRIEDRIDKEFENEQRSARDPKRRP